MTAVDVLVFIVGLAPVILLGQGVSRVLRQSTEGLRLNDGKESWRSLPEAGVALGFFERIAFYTALTLQQPVFIGAWLVFKVAAKWDTWAHIIRLPEMEVGKFDSDEFHIRQRFGTWLMIRFLLGTLLNILLATLGAWLYSVASKAI